MIVAKINNGYGSFKVKDCPLYVCHYYLSGVVEYCMVKRLRKPIIV